MTNAINVGAAIRSARIRWLTWWLIELLGESAISGCGHNRKKFRTLLKTKCIETRINANMLGVEELWCDGVLTAVFTFHIGLLRETDDSYANRSDQNPQPCPNCNHPARVKRCGTLICRHCGAIREPMRILSDAEIQQREEVLARERVRRATILVSSEDVEIPSAGSDYL